jgi:hypothetical protein
VHGVFNGKYNFILINPKSNSKKIGGQTFEFSRDLIFRIMEFQNKIKICF